LAEDYDINIRGISTLLALAAYLKKYSLWSKDLVFIISDGSLAGMHAWLSTYHGHQQKSKSDIVDPFFYHIHSSLKIWLPNLCPCHLV
jgi:hypothetical protein